MNERQKTLIKKLLYYSRYYALKEVFQAPSEPRLLIIMLHNVVRDTEQRSSWFSRDMSSETQLEAVLIALKKHFRVISVEEAVREIRITGKLKEKSAAITIDDGYRSTYDLVYPRLREHGLTATVYIPTDWIDGKLSPWWISLIELVDRLDLTRSLYARVGKIIGETVEIDPKVLKDTANARQDLRHRIEWNLMHREDHERDQIIQELRTELATRTKNVPPIEEPMTWDQIKEMGDNGIMFGAHTLSHPNLSHIDLDQAEREIVESKRVLESHLGSQVDGFAYPYGYDVEGYRRLGPILEKHRFTYACTSWCGYVDSTTNRYLLGRVGLPLSASTAVIARTLSVEYTSQLK